MAQSRCSAYRRIIVSGTTDSGQKKCRYCASLIDSSASVCPTCRYRQCRVLNWIVFWGSAAGLIALIVSGIVYSVTTARPLFWWSDRVNVHYFHTFSNGHYALSLSNSGSGPILVSEVTAYIGAIENYPFHVDKTVDAGAFLTIAVKDLQKEFVGLSGGYLANTDGRAPASVVSDASMQWNDFGKCYAIFLINSGAEDIGRMNQAFAALNKKLVTYPADVKVVFFDAWTGKKFDQSFPVVATFVQSSDSKCKATGG
jgi:hypothetical protein